MIFVFTSGSTEIVELEPNLNMKAFTALNEAIVGSRKQRSDKSYSKEGLTVLQVTAL